MYLFIPPLCSVIETAAGNKSEHSETGRILRSCSRLLDDLKSVEEIPTTAVAV